MSNSSLVTYTKISPNSTNPRRDKIKKITIHHMAGNATIEACGQGFADPNRDGSSNYGIGTDGRIGMYVEECNRAWTSSNADNDNQAVTIEVANDGGAPDWHVSDKALASLIDLCVDICKRNDIKKLNFTGDATGNLTMHKYFVATTCVPTNTEVLTKTGWKTIKDVSVGEKIACADINNVNMSFEVVYDKTPIKVQDTYTCNNFTATKDHRMMYRSQYSNIWKIDEYKNILGTNYYIPIAGISNFEGLSISDTMLKFLVATQADGHYMYEINSENVKKYYGLEFHLKKDRKIIRIKEILNDLELNYNENIKSDGSVSIRIYNQEGINIVEDLCEKYLNNKIFTWDWINLSKEQAELFLSEIMLWDGCVTAKKYSSTIRQNLDIVNAIAALNNVGSRIKDKDVIFRDPYVTLNSDVIRNNQTVKKNKDLTEVTCVSVKTGIFLARQNGRTFIIGNCPGAYLESKFPYIANEVNKRLTEPKYVGNLDKATFNTISGWAWNSINDNALKVSVKIYKGTKVVKTLTTTAKTYRNDLKKANKGNGKHGFTIAFDFTALGEGTYTVKVFTNGVQLSGTKTVVIPRCSGYLDKANTTTIGGWAWNTVNDAAVKVDIKIYNKVGKIVKTLTTTAETYRADLKKVNKGNGKHGFNVKFNFATLSKGTYTVKAFANSTQLSGVKIVDVK